MRSFLESHHNYNLYSVCASKTQPKKYLFCIRTCHMKTRYENIIKSITAVPVSQPRIDIIFTFKKTSNMVSIDFCSQSDHNTIIVYHNKSIFLLQIFIKLRLMSFLSAVDCHIVIYLTHHLAGTNYDAKFDFD